MIKKAILPVAGLGTRFLPASKAIPKEMVTVVDRPAIEYVVREAVAAGIEQIILVTHSSKASIENYFDRNFELETTLEQKKKFDLLKEITDILPKHVSVVSVRQPQPLGLGHAVLLPDVLVKNQSCDNDLSLMIQRFECDVWYVDHHNIWVDFKIMLKTVSVMIKREGINAPGHVGPSLFTGNNPSNDEKKANTTQ